MADDREIEEKFWKALTDSPFIMLGVEGTRDGPALRHAFEVALAADKPVLVLRSGKSIAGASAAASHTGAVAGEDAVWRALFRQAGVIECKSLSEMIGITRLLQRRAARAARPPMLKSV